MGDQYAVMGHPIAHSKSPFIHQLFAEAVGHDLTYRTIDAPPDGFADAVAAFKAGGGRGLNVTVPFKTEACALAGELSQRARLAGAANTLVLDREVIFADNTDGIGLVRDLSVNHGVEIAGAQVLLLGAGGAARGVALPVLECGPAKLTIGNRTQARAQALGVAFGPHGLVEACELDKLPHGGFDIVINSTSAGLDGKLPAVAPEVLKPGAVVYDLVYGPASQGFAQWAERARAGAFYDGLGMLVEQAAESFSIWRGVRPPTEAVTTALRASLAGA